MWGLIIILLILNVFLWIFLKKILKRFLYVKRATFLQGKDNYEKLRQENAVLQQENLKLQEQFEATMLIYDITSQICKTLDEQQVFESFRQEINKYILLSECKFIKQEEELAQYKDCVVVPLMVDRHTAGYLLALGLRDEDKDKFHILSQQFLLAIKRAILYKGVQELSITDSLTGMFNRRYYLERYNEEIARASKFKYNFSCLMLDIDHFKHYNDHYGHLVGDAILRELSATIKENIRQIDLLGRYGGEEFSILLTETGKEDARFVAERIRQAVESRRIKVYDEELNVTLSIGIAAFPADGKDTQALIEHADSALYMAKEAGRNRVCLYP
ncbi:MAG: GGDEF domain-containing protein [Candidatus Omnitrophota bacterium]